MTKPIVAFRSFGKTSKKQFIIGVATTRHKYVKQVNRDAEYGITRKESYMGQKIYTSRHTH